MILNSGECRRQFDQGLTLCRLNDFACSKAVRAIFAGIDFFSSQSVQSQGIPLRGAIGPPNVEQGVHNQFPRLIKGEVNEHSNSGSPREKAKNKRFTPVNDSVIVIYKTHCEAKAAVRKLEHGGIPIHKISIIGRDFQLREDVQGYYRRPSDAAKEGPVPARSLKQTETATNLLRA